MSLREGIRIAGFLRVIFAQDVDEGKHSCFYGLFSVMYVYDQIIGHSRMMIALDFRAIRAIRI